MDQKLGEELSPSPQRGVKVILILLLFEFKIHTTFSPIVLWLVQNPGFSQKEQIRVTLWAG